LPLDNFLVELYNVVGHGLPSPFECLCRNFILPETGKPCLLFLADFAQLIIPYPYAIEPPYTERYVRWCERSATQLMGSLLLD
jgi:hypothetical protein